MASRLLVDLGWPGLFGALQAELRRKDIPLKEITHGFATHYHMDHAGAAQDLKNKGMRLLRHAGTGRRSAGDDAVGKNDAGLH